MADTLAAAGFYAMFYGLGAVGFVAVTALPARVWLFARRYAWAWRSSLAQRVALALVLVAGLVAIALAASCLYSVARCLLGYHCSANRAGGWIWLAAVGFWYLAFELIAALVARVALRRPSSQPNNSSKPTPLRGAA
jgi:hypothetical protein